LWQLLEKKVSGVKKSNAYLMQLLPIALFGAMLVLSFWSAGRFSHPSVFGARLLVTFAAGLLVWRVWAVCMTESIKRKSRVWMRMAVMLAAVGVGVWFPKSVGVKLYLTGFESRIRSVAPLSEWERLSTELQAISDEVGRVPSARLPLFVKEIHPGEAVYCSVLVNTELQKTPNALISWRDFGFGVGVQIGRGLPDGSKIHYARPLGKIRLIAFTDE
jgi:hypothetical protein